MKSHSRRGRAVSRHEFARSIRTFSRRSLHRSLRLKSADEGKPVPGIRVGIQSRALISCHSVNKTAFDNSAQLLLIYLFYFRFRWMINSDALESSNENSLIVKNVIDTRSEHSQPLRSNSLLGLIPFCAKGSFYLLIRRCIIVALVQSGCDVKKRGPFEGLICLPVRDRRGRTQP